MSLMAILTGDLEIAADNLTELEILNPSNESIIKLSDFRMDLEEGQTAIDRVSPRGFDFFSYMVDWLRNRFSESDIYDLSGLKMDESFDILKLHTREGDGEKGASSRADFDPSELIEKFNILKGETFQKACESIIDIQGYTAKKTLPNREKDGADIIAASKLDSSDTALFRIRQWANQPISDIFVRNMQNYMNEQKVKHGFVVAGTRLTNGAEEALKNLSKITVINEHDFGEILWKLFGKK